MLFRLAAAACRPLIAVLFRPRVRGTDLVPRGGVVVAPNHLSGWDTIAIAYALPGRRLRTMAKPQLFVRPLLGPLVRAVGAFPAGDGAVEAAARLARAGETVVIYPEGARHRPGREHRPRPGAARVALDGGVPLVPAAIHGTDGSRRLRRWEVAFGEPVALDAFDPADPAAAREATAVLWDRIAALRRITGA